MLTLKNLKFDPAALALALAGTVAVAQPARVDLAAAQYCAEELEEQLGLTLDDIDEIGYTSREATLPEFMGLTAPVARRWEAELAGTPTGRAAQMAASVQFAEGGMQIHQILIRVTGRPSAIACSFILHEQDEEMLLTHRPVHIRINGLTSAQRTWSELQTNLGVE